MVKIPIGNGSKNATLMVVYAHSGRGKAESRTQTQRAQDHSDLGHLRTEGVDDETTHDSECAEDQQLLEHTFRRKWKQVNHENEQAIMEARNSNHRRRKSEAMSKAWRVITDAFVQ